LRTNHSKSSPSNLGTARRSCTSTQQSPHWLQWDVPNLPPKLPISLRRLPPHLTHHRSIDPTHHPRRHPVCHKTLSGPTDRQTDRPTDGIGYNSVPRVLTLYYTDTERRANNSLDFTVSVRGTLSSLVHSVHGVMQMYSNTEHFANVTQWFPAFPCLNTWTRVVIFALIMFLSSIIKGILKFQWTSIPRIARRWCRSLCNSATAVLLFVRNCRIPSARPVQIYRVQIGLCVWCIVTLLCK